MKEINNIHALALNYKGIGNDNEPPLYFLKSRGCLTFEGGTVPYPTFETDQVWTEVELAIVMGRNLRVKGLMVAGDITCDGILKRDHHLPMSKARTGFCPVGAFTPINEVNLDIPFTMTTSINGVETQRGTTEDIKYNIFQAVEYISKFAPLYENDIILTGTCLTPGGGPQYDCIVKPGDQIKHTIERIGELNYSFK